MNSGTKRFAMGAILIVAGLYAWNHFPPRRTVAPLTQEVRSEPVNQEDQLPLPSARSKDRIEDSPVGTSNQVVHKTFTVARTVHVPFEIPAHAITPRFHGTFQSFAQGGSPTHDDTANIDLLLMNESQYEDFAAGRESDVLLIADTSHYQDITFDLSPSQDQPVQYHLVFRNTPSGAAKKVVQADFSVDF